MSSINQGGRPQPIEPEDAAIVGAYAPDPPSHHTDDPDTTVNYGVPERASIYGSQLTAEDTRRVARNAVEQTGIPQHVHWHSKGNVCNSGCYVEYGRDHVRAALGTTLKLNGESL